MVVIFRKKLWYRVWLLCIREARILASRPLYLFGMIIAPLFTALFFLTLMGKGLPQDLPIAVVDNDNSAVSRRVVRQLDAFKQTKVAMKYANFQDARRAMQEGYVYAIFYIPDNFEKDVMASRQPKFSFYMNNSYLIAGSLLYRDLRTISVLGSAAVAKEFKTARGQTEDQAMTELQPIGVDTHLIGNPLTNYSVYLCNLIIPGVYNIVIMLLTIYALGNELKRNTSRVLLRMSNNKMFVALFAKMFPHTLIYCSVITLIDVILYKFMQFPCALGIGSMLAASYSLIIASQSLAIFLFGLLPIMRLSLSAASLISVVSLSISGFTFPVSEMHYVLQCWSNFFPLRHFFLLYVDQALNGLGFEYTWHIYLALALFLFLPLVVMKSIKRVYLTYKYIP